MSCFWFFFVSMILLVPVGLDSRNVAQTWPVEGLSLEQGLTILLKSWIIVSAVCNIIMWFGCKCRTLLDSVVMSAGVYCKARCSTRVYDATVCVLVRISVQHQAYPPYASLAWASSTVNFATSPSPFSASLTSPATAVELASSSTPLTFRRSRSFSLLLFYRLAHKK